MPEIVQDLIGNADSLRWPFVLLGVVLSLAGIANRGELNRLAHRASNMRSARVSMIRTSAVSFAANKIIRSGGVSGMAVFVRRGHRDGHQAGAVVGACLIAGVAVFLATGALLLGAIVVLALTGTVETEWLAATAAFAISIVLVIALVTRGTQTSMVDRAWGWCQRAHRRLTRRKGAAPLDPSFPDHLRTALSVARQGPADLRRVMSHAMISKVLGIGMIAIAAGAAGIDLSFSDSVTIYAAAIVVAFIAVVPGGGGAVEVSTAALLINAGAGTATAALAIALFRIFDLWLPAAIGALLARSELRRQPVEAPATFEAEDPVASSTPLGPSPVGPAAPARVPLPSRAAA